MRYEAERIRIKYLYRSLVVKGRAVLRPEVARKIVGPDCAYHLYALDDGGAGAAGRRRRPKGRSAAGGRGR